MKEYKVTVSGLTVHEWKDGGWVTLPDRSPRPRTNVGVGLRTIHAMNEWDKGFPIPVSVLRGVFFPGQLFVSFNVVRDKEPQGHGLLKNVLPVNFEVRKSKHRPRGVSLNGVACKVITQGIIALSK